MSATGFSRIAVVALVLAAAGYASPAAAAAVVEPDDPQRRSEIARPLDAYALDTEMTVHGWILCTARPFAEEIAMADGVDAALDAYRRLKEAKSCGMFPELRVILREALFESAPGAVRDTRAFGASVNLGGNWARAFLVDGHLPAE